MGLTPPKKASEFKAVLSSTGQADYKENADDFRFSFGSLIGDLEDGDKYILAYKTDTSVAAQAFRFLYDSWVRRGGYERGKPRHSVRQIKIWLGNDEVRSLETKLSGRTWLQYEDAFRLLRLFLDKWTYRNSINDYLPYREGNIDEITQQVLSDLIPTENAALLLPERNRNATKQNSILVKNNPTSNLLTEALSLSEDKISEFFEKSDALITVSRARTIIGDNPAEAMLGFHNLMSKLHAIDEQDSKNRTLIWLVDLGLRDDKISSRVAIYNLYFLIAQFRAIALISREGREDLYNWLIENTCFIVGSLSHSEIDRICDRFELKLSDVPHDFRFFQSDRLFLESIPGRWLDVEGSDAFKLAQRQLWMNPTITAHLRLDGWDYLDHSYEIDTQRNLRYLFHGEVESALPDKKEATVRCISLPEPGARWSDAFRIAIHAARGRLDRSHGKLETSVSGLVSPNQALAVLGSQTFAVLRLSELLQFTEIIIGKGVFEKGF